MSGADVTSLLSFADEADLEDELTDEPIPEDGDAPDEITEEPTDDDVGEPSDTEEDD